MSHRLVEVANRSTTSRTLTAYGDLGPRDAGSPTNGGITPAAENAGIITATSLAAQRAQRPPQRVVTLPKDASETTEAPAGSSRDPACRPSALGNGTTRAQ